MADTLFHGSGKTVIAPEVRITQYTKDFGYGFYCTKNFTQAKRWAKRHDDTEKGEIPTVNLYLYTPSKKLKIKRFTKVTGEWLDFIALCRNSDGVTPHDYDIVEGPMADDSVWDHVEDYMEGRISKKQFLSYAKFKHPTHQISFHTPDALACLKFEKEVVVNESE